MNALGRPTFEVRRVDMSSDHPSRSAVPASSEERLFNGYSGMSGLVTLPCVCGGNVTADPDAPARGVAAHQFTGRHKAWRANREEA